MLMDWARYKLIIIIILLPQYGYFKLPFLTVKLITLLTDSLALRCGMVLHKSLSEDGRWCFPVLLCLHHKLHTHTGCNKDMK